MESIIFPKSFVVINYKNYDAFCAHEKKNFLFFGETLSWSKKKIRGNSIILSFSFKKKSNISFSRVNEKETSFKHKSDAFCLCMWAVTYLNNHIVYILNNRLILMQRSFPSKKLYRCFFILFNCFFFHLLHIFKLLFLLLKKENVCVFPIQTRWIHLIMCIVSQFIPIQWSFSIRFPLWLD